MGEEVFLHWIWGENNVIKNRQTYLINLKIGVSIRFNYEEAAFASYEEFVDNVADIQFIYGSRPNKDDVDNILTEAWNFLCAEEIQLSMDFEDIEGIEDI